MKANQLAKQGTKKNLASIIFIERAYKVNITVDPEGQGKNKSIQFPTIQSYTLLQHMFCVRVNACPDSTTS